MDRCVVIYVHIYIGTSLPACLHTYTPIYTYLHTHTHIVYAYPEPPSYLPRTAASSTDSSTAVGCEALAVGLQNQKRHRSSKGVLALEAKCLGFRVQFFFKGSFFTGFSFLFKAPFLQASGFRV